MKISSVVLAALGGVAGLAQAQSTVDIYGMLDAGMVHESGGAAGTVNRLGSGISAGSRLGFRGTENLGGGLSVHFLLESGFQVDTGEMGQGSLFGRQIFVGIKSGLGAINVGLQYTPYYLALCTADPFICGFSGKASGVMAGAGTRMDNTVKYNTPVFSGISAEVAYRFGETAGGMKHNSAYGGSLNYVNGPLQLKLAHHNKNIFALASSTTTARDSDAKNSILAAVYTFHAVKASLAYAVNKGEGSSPYLVPKAYGPTIAASTDSRDMLVGVTVPIGAHALMASYIRKDDRDVANRDAKKFSIGYCYALSKRTQLYASYSKINNENGASYTVANAIELGTGNTGSNIGISHTF